MLIIIVVIIKLGTINAYIPRRHRTLLPLVEFGVGGVEVFFSCLREFV